MSPSDLVLPFLDDSVRRLRRVGLVALSLVGLGSAAVAADTRFGVMTHFAQGWDPALASVVKGANVTQVRDELYWSAIETKKGVYTFPATFDTYMKELAQKGITPLIVLDFENPLYDGGNTPYTTEGFNAYARYAVQVLRRYGTQIKAVEIWNEYNGGFCKGPAANDRTGTYLKMLQVAYAAIKKERPDVTVLAGGTAGVPLPYWEKLLAGGVLNYADGLSIHPYRYTLRPEGMEQEIADFRALIARYGTPKPIWASEIGWELKPKLAPDDFAIDEETQARFLTRAYALLLSAGVDHIYWYLLSDTWDFKMGLIREDAKRTPKPAYQALAALAKHLDGAQFLRREATVDDVYSLVFRTAAGVEKRVLWSENARSLALTGITAATDLKGKAIAIGSKITVNAFPLLVTGPMKGLPAAPAARTVLADSRADFPTREGGWQYGAYAPGTKTFAPLGKYTVTDWKSEWTGAQPYISITAVDQHPSFSGALPVSVVRRWTSERAQKVRVVGNFRASMDGGDGVGVGIVVDGTPRYRKLLGGGKNAILDEFNFVLSVSAGTTIDFAVDPGPAARVDFDVTQLDVQVRREP